MEQREIQHFVEAALLAAGRPVSLDQLQGLFDGRSTPEKSELRGAIDALNTEYRDRGIEVVEVASGFRLQIKNAMADRLQKLWEDRPPRYSRALFETLALVAYRQPITRGEIEDIRGVAVSSNIVRSLLERDWIRVVGHRDVPGRPAMFGTTKGFLDYFGLKKLDDLPQLADLSDWESLRVQLDLPAVDGTDPERPEDEIPVPVLVPDIEASNDDDDLSDEASLAGHDEVPELTPIDDDELLGDVHARDEFIDEDTAGDAAADIMDHRDAIEPGEEDIPVIQPEDDELLVSEWPDPAESGRG
ncbi:MAG TPA: SMC-Scp complex subunit ScpB [Woeseiaceae bacterium]|nr:SMC-Scp complex subunit ScpB [Woeseiaceae bacterium]